jgi:hypothetical protein
MVPRAAFLHPHNTIAPLIAGQLTESGEIGYAKREHNENHYNPSRSNLGYRTKVVRQS